MFTPGPWRVSEQGYVVTDNPVGPLDTSSLLYYGGHVVCETITPSNARLVAAAPDMYDLLLDLKHGA